LSSDDGEHILENLITVGGEEDIQAVQIVGVDIVEGCAASVLLGGNKNTTCILLSHVYFFVAGMVDWLVANPKIELR
jgi:hypothetical protein